MSILTQCDVACKHLHGSTIMRSRWCLSTKGITAKETMVAFQPTDGLSKLYPFHSPNAWGYSRLQWRPKATICFIHWTLILGTRDTPKRSFKPYPGEPVPCLGPGDLCAMRACVHASACLAFIMLSFWALVTYLAVNLWLRGCGYQSKETLQSKTWTFSP